MIEEILQRLEAERIVLLDPDRLHAMLEETEVLEDQDTWLSDRIRILRAGERILIQEMTDRKQVAIRAAGSLEEAKEFVQKRLETYERMWDGCGCKVDYNE